MEEGYIKVYRKLLDWKWYKNPNTLSVFMYCLLSANWSDGFYEGVEVKRGQLLTTLPVMSKATGLSIQNVRTAINHLKSTGELTDTSYSKYRVITVLKYNDYQDINSLPNSQLTGNQQATNRQLTGNQQATNRQEVVSSNNIKEEKEEKEEKESKKERNIKEDVAAIAARTPSKPKASKADNNLRVFDQMVQAYGFTDLIIDSMSEWMKYKGDEKKYEYKETGMKALLTQVKKHVDEYGDRAVADLVSQCMASGWQGIIWDKLNSNGQNKGSNSNSGYTFMDWLEAEYG